eukprot:GHVU01142242.1.p1 GENE.GHVU01142242.1~~GHVU01142242.1.p1  ORF type:complete len:227 (+),score=42.80 GHVU01142242.1:407-1087(+)
MYSPAPPEDVEPVDEVSGPAAAQQPQPPVVAVAAATAATEATAIQQPRQQRLILPIMEWAAELKGVLPTPERVQSVGQYFNMFQEHAVHVSGAFFSAFLRREASLENRLGIFYVCNEVLQGEFTKQFHDAMLSQFLTPISCLVSRDTKYNHKYINTINVLWKRNVIGPVDRERLKLFYRPLLDVDAREEPPIELAHIHLATIMTGIKVTIRGRALIDRHLTRWSPR